MEEIISNNNKIISLLLEEEEKDEIYNPLKINKRKSIDSFFTTHDEGFFEILINGH